MYNQILAIIRQRYGAEGFIPLHAPVFRGSEKEYLMECIDTTFVSSVGKYVDKFEEAVASYTGAKRAVVIVNGTNALFLALKLCGVEPDTEVITQALTFVATANAISYCNANPVFIDVDKKTMGLSYERLKLWLEKNVEIVTKDGVRFAVNKYTYKRVSACVPMHTFGHPVEIDKIVTICDTYFIPVVEDAAESLGTLYKGKHTGTFGKMGVLSFNGNKIVTTGGGGMILTNDEVLGNKIKHLTTQAKVPHPWEFVHDDVGYNYRMPNVNAAIGVAQMEQIEKNVINKRQTAEYYKKQLKGINFFMEPEHARANYWLNCMVMDNMLQRDEFLKYSNERGVMTRPIWKLMNKLPMFANAVHDGLENSKWFEERVVNIPSSVL